MLIRLCSIQLAIDYLNRNRNLVHCHHEETADGSVCEGCYEVRHRLARIFIARDGHTVIACSDIEKFPDASDEHDGCKDIEYY